MSPEDARDTYKQMKRIGVAIDSADFYIGWARLEAAEGNADKARDILRKGEERGDRVDQGALKEALTSIPHERAAGPQGELTPREQAPRPALADARQRVPLKDMPNPSKSSLALRKPPKEKVADRAAVVERAAATEPTADMADQDETVQLPEGSTAAPSTKGFSAEGSDDPTIVISRQNPSQNSKPKPKLGKLGLGKLGKARRASPSDAESISSPPSAPDLSRSYRGAPDETESGKDTASQAVATAAADSGRPRILVPCPAEADSRADAARDPGGHACTAGSTGVRGALAPGAFAATLGGDSLDDTVACPALQVSLTAIHEVSSEDGSPGSTAAATPAVEPRRAELKALASPAPRLAASSSLPLAATPRGGAGAQPPPSTPFLQPPPSTPSIRLPPSTPAATPTARAGLQTPKASATAEPTVNFLAKRSTPAAFATPTATPAGGGSRAVREALVVNGVPYTKLALLGKGGTSKVFKVISPEGSVLALKVVSLADDDDESLKGAVVNEIELMRQLLRHVKEKGLPDVIVELVDAEVKEEEQVVLIVMELGEIDLAHMGVQSLVRDNGSLNEIKICDFWQQMLQAAPFCVVPFVLRHAMPALHLYPPSPPSISTFHLHPPSLPSISTCQSYPNTTGGGRDAQGERDPRRSQARKLPLCQGRAQVDRLWDCRGRREGRQEERQPRPDPADFKRAAGAMRPQPICVHTCMCMGMLHVVYQAAGP